ncbi:hypothetical protein [Pseudomonas lini]
MNHVQLPTRPSPSGFQAAAEKLNFEQDTKCFGMHQALLNEQIQALEQALKAKNFLFALDREHP